MTEEARPAVGAALAAVVGETHVWTGERAAAFAVDGLVPRWVAFPGRVEEMSRCLALATAEGLAVSPTGSGTRLHWGNPPRALDVVLSLRRLDRILAHEPADQTISVEAGARLLTLNDRLRAYRQCVPLDPARAEEATVGGLIATGASGPYRARYGTMRELLLGLTLVQADGTIVKGGGQVVKNVTGYDMPKLHVGGLGTLGVVVATHLRLHPVAVEERTWLFGFSSAESLLDAALSIMDAPLVVSRLQLVNGATLAACGQVGPTPAGLAVTIGSVSDGVRTQGAQVEAICSRGGGAALSLGDSVEWWGRVRKASWPDEPASGLTLRIGTRPSDVVKALRVIEAVALAGMVRATAEVANGVLRVALPGRVASEVPPLVARIREGLAPLGATCVVEHAPLSAKATLDVWGEVGPALGLMRGLKAELDPRGVLNPGRFVGGI
ncbi:MAG: FAD-binding oxidoreductase [Candidatus Rokuibacteriota bacterium]